MSAKIDYLNQQLTGVVSQLNADNGRATLFDLVGQAKAILKVREATGEEPNAARVGSLVTAISNAAASYNAANQLNIPSAQEIMDGYNALPTEE